MLKNAKGGIFNFGPKIQFVLVICFAVLLFGFKKFINICSCLWRRHYFLPFYCYCSDWLLRSALLLLLLLLHAKIWPQVTTMLQWRTENDQQMNKQASTMLQILTSKRAANKQLLTSMLQLWVAILNLFRERCFKFWLLGDIHIGLQLMTTFWPNHKRWQHLQLTRMPYSSSVCPLRHKKSRSFLLLLYFSNMVKWISPKLLTVFLTT